MFLDAMFLDYTFLDIPFTSSPSNKSPFKTVRREPIKDDPYVAPKKPAVIRVEKTLPLKTHRQRIDIRGPV